MASVRRVWGALSNERRAAVIGVTPAFVAVLVHEARALQRLNAQYDRGAYVNTAARSIAGPSGWLSGWRASKPEAQRALVASMGLNDAQVAALAAAAESIRSTQRDLALVLDDRNVTQRELDAQDGRVVHLIALVYGAFRDATRRDPAIALPDLGELHTWLVRPDRRPRKTADKPA